MIILVVVLGVWGLWGLWLTGFFLRNLEFFTEAHKEIRARKKL